MTKADLYQRLVCALTHDLSVCDNCKKCGNGVYSCRINLIKELAKIMKQEVP